MGIYLPRLMGTGRRVSKIIALMISARDEWIQLKFLHRVYYSLQRSSCIYATTVPTCPKYQASMGTFHMVLSCPPLQDFQKGVASEVGSGSEVTISMDPLMFLLGICDTSNTIHHTSF